MSPQPTATELYKELHFEFSFWKDFAMSREYPLPLMDVWIEDYKTMVSLYDAAKCAGLEAAKLSECYGNIEKVYEDMIAAQKLRATVAPWEKVHQVVTHLHGKPPLLLQVPTHVPGQDAEVAAEEVPPAPVLASVDEVPGPGSTVEEIRLPPDPEPGDNSSPLPPEMTLPPVTHNAAGIVAPKYYVSGAASKPPETFKTLPRVAHNAAGVVAPKSLVSGAASKPPETIKKFSKDEKTLPPAMYTADGVVAPKYFVSGAASKPPETFQRFSKDEIPAFKGSDGLLLMQSKATYNVANDDPHGTTTKGGPILAAQVTSWMVTTDTEELPAARTWIFPAIGIGVLQFAATATDKVKQEVKSGLNHYLLTKTFPKGIRGDYESAEQEQMFTNTVGGQHNAESVSRKADLYYSKVTQFKAKKFAEFFGNRRKKKKKLNLMEILRKARIQIIIQMKRKLTMKLMKRMNRRKMLMKRSRIYSETFSSLSFQTWPWQCHIIMPTACLRLCSGIKYEDENSNAEISHVLSPQVTRPIRTRKLFN